MGGAPRPMPRPPDLGSDPGSPGGSLSLVGAAGVLQRLLEPRRLLPDQACSPKAALSCKPSASLPRPRPGARAALAPNGEACDVRG